MFYRWQKEFFENAAAAFEPCSRHAGHGKDRGIALLEENLRLIPSMVRKHKDYLKPIRVRADKAREEWMGSSWFVMMIDEVTRCTTEFADTLLSVLNDFQVAIEGKIKPVPATTRVEGRSADGWKKYCVNWPRRCHPGECWSKRRSPTRRAAS